MENGRAPKPVCNVPTRWNVRSVLLSYFHKTCGTATVPLLCCNRLCCYSVATRCGGEARRRRRRRRRARGGHPCCYSALTVRHCDTCSVAAAAGSPGLRPHDRDLIGVKVVNPHSLTDIPLFSTRPASVPYRCRHRGQLRRLFNVGPVHGGIQAVRSSFGSHSSSVVVPE